MKSSSSPRPTPVQLAWQEMELGMFVHFEMFTYAPDWNWRSFKDYPSPDLFNPTKLDTDQWLEAAKSMGAKYAVLTAKHCSGFCLWPVEGYDYGVRQSKWRNGKGDVVGDFVRSCHKHHIKPGLYYSVSANGYCKVDNPGLVQGGDAKEQKDYADLCERHLSDLWTRYGELAEIWFDGGVPPPSQGGPDLAPLIKKYQPKAVVFQGPSPSAIRWIGNEDGVAPYPCWSAVSEAHPDSPEGDPDGSIWRPGECDVPIRRGEWGWKADQEDRVESVDHLMGLYYKSVGRNANLLLNSNPNPDGLIPEQDFARYAEFGAEIKRRFGKPIAETHGKGDKIAIDLAGPTKIDHVIISEDITEGQRIRRYVLEGLIDGSWEKIAEGSSVGNKRIESFSPVEATKIRLSCEEATSMPVIKRLAAFRANA